VFGSNPNDVHLIDKHYYFESILHDHPPLFSVCSYFGAIQCLEFLLSCNSSCSVADRRGRRPYHFAAAGNQVCALRHIYQALRLQAVNPEAEILSGDGDGCSVVHLAAEADALDIFHYLFVHFGSPAIFDSDSGRGTPLQIARQYHRTRCIRFLADLNLAAMASGSKLPIDFNRRYIQKPPIILLLKAGAYE
jgi:hypothetical protein